MPKRLVRIFLCLAAALAPVAASAQTKLLRFPDVHGDEVVFTYAGDLWTAPASGGTATRLTAHPGLELFAKFSPDGKWIAFTGQYDGDEQVYVVPATGGVPRQLTFYPARGPLPPRWGYDNQVLGWTPDGKAILFRALRDGWDLADSRLYTVPVEGGPAAPLPMPVSGAGDLSPDGKRVVYTPMARDFRTWKRYQGGWAQDLWIFDLASHEQQNITHHPRTDRDPMWIGDKIYFASDRTGTLNLYSYDPGTAKTEQLTRSTTWDVRWPSADEQGQIIYEQGGELAVYDTRTGRSRQLAILVPDDGVWSRPSRVAAAALVESLALSPKGERALFTARGDVFTAPIEKGSVRNLTRSSGAHDKWARWSPDGARIAFVSDLDGEDQLYLVAQDGSGAPEQLTHGGKAFLYAPAWSPDGKRIAFGDQDGRVWVLTLADRKVIQVADDRHSRVRDYVWSPDGGYLAFTLANANTNRSLHIWSVADGQLHRVTGDFFDVFSPAWDPQGKYLYYLSEREFHPQVDYYDFTYAMDRSAGIFALALRQDVGHPFPPESDEVTLAGNGKEEKGAAAADKGGKDKDEKEKGDKGKGDKAAAPAPLRIDFDGLAERVARVPVAFDDYTHLQAAEGKLLYLKETAFFYGRDPVARPALRLFTLKDRKETTLDEGVDDFALSQDGAKVLAREGETFKLFDATPAGKNSPKVVATKDLMVDRVPAEEWAEIFAESWRRYRDFFYVPSMNGYDWEALRRQYRPLLAYVHHRSDLNYVIGEMIAELNNSHTYVAGGDLRPPERPRVALPGARFELDRASGRYRIARIFHGQNEEDAYRAPLTEVGVDARVGDYVLAIDGEELAAKDDPYRLLRYKADRAVHLTLNDRPRREGARDVLFRPVASEIDLLYLDWVTRNRQRVDAATGGRVGYIHIPDMGEDGLREFVKSYYTQLRKEGLIVDVRSNGGGDVSGMLLDRLRRTLLSVDFSRQDEDPVPFPAGTFHGPMVALINETTSSDGDIFSYMFRLAGLGPLVGKRTWGGVVGISDTGPLIDGGSISVPESATASLDGQWIIEGHGVDPDIDVEQDPKAVIAGHDPQLERAIAEVLRRMQEHPKKLPQRPPPPVRTQQP
jgi:tricorn protease